MDFEFIKKFDNDNPPSSFKLYRSKNTQDQYDNHYQSNFFIDFKNKITTILKEKLFYITKNTYPYHFIDDTLHYLIWFRSESNLNFTQIIEDYFKINKSNYTYFENLEKFKSIKEIRHIHIFINTKN